MNKKQKLPFPAVIALIVVGALLFFLVGYMTLVSPKHKKAADLAKQQVAAQKQIDDLRSAALLATHQTPIKVANLVRLGKAMPDQADMAGVLLQLNRVAADSGITFESISPSASQPLTGYQAVPIQLIFKGNFYDLSDFLFRLRNLVTVDSGRLQATGRLFAIDTLSFAEAKDGFPQIEANLLVDAFVYGTGTPATGGPPAGSTTSTPGSTTATPPTSTSTLPTPAAPSASAATAAGATP